MGCLWFEGIHSGCGYFCWRWFISLSILVGQHGLFTDISLVQQGLVVKGEALFMDEPFYVKILLFMEQYFDFAAEFSDPFLRCSSNYFMVSSLLGSGQWPPHGNSIGILVSGSWPKTCWTLWLGPCSHHGNPFPKTFKYPFLMDLNTQFWDTGLHLGPSDLSARPLPVHNSLEIVEMINGIPIHGKGVAEFLLQTWSQKVDLEWSQANNKWIKSESYLLFGS